MRTQIPIIVIAVFFISILLAQIGVVFAQVFTVVTGMQERVRAISYQSSTDSFWVLSEGNGFTWLHQIDRSTRSNIFSYNHTDTFDDLSAGVTQDIWCGQTSCYITTTSGLVAGITSVDIAPNIFKGINVTGTYTHPNPLKHLTGRDQVSGGFGSVTLWIDTFTGTNRNVIIVDGISFTLTGTLPAYGGTGVDEVVHDIRWSEIAGITDNDLITSTGFITDTASQNSIVVYNLATLAVKCSVAIASDNNPLAVAPNYISAGNANNKFYVGSIDGIVYVYNENTCLVTQTFSTGLTGDIRFLDYDSGRLFVQENGANAFIKQFAVNSTGFILATNTTYSPLPSVAQNTFDSVETTLTNARFWLLAGNGQLWFPYTGNDEKVGILIYEAIPEGGGGTIGGTDCDLPENQFILICRLGQDGAEVGSAGAFVIGNVSQGTGILGIGCNMGLVDCTEDDNPQTNGLGLLIFIASIFMIVGMFYAGLGGQNTWALFHGSPIILVLIIVALSAFFTITGIIDPVFLILSIVGIIALATPKIIGTIQNRGFGGGGSTE